MSVAESLRKRQGLVFGALLIVSLSLNIVPVWWGLPSVGDASWAYDEISPDRRGSEVSTRHRGRYPPLHYDLLRVVYKPVRQLQARGLINLPDDSFEALLHITGRTLSALMATATVLLLFLAARRLLKPPGAWLAAALLALSAPFVFYAKTINLEAAYIFWFALSLVFFVRILQGHRLIDYLAFATTMTFSICTKDQAAALYVLPLLWLPVELHRSNRETPGSSRSPWRSIFDRRLVWSGLLALLLFALIHQLFSGLSGFQEHIAAMRGPGSRAWKEYEPTLASQAAMLLQAAKHMSFAMGWPGFIASIAGLGIAIHKRKSEQTLLTLTLFPISYYLFFVLIAQFHYVRFFLPVVVVLCVFAGRSLVALVKGPTLKPIGWVAISLILVFALRRPLSLDLQMLHDSRYEVEEWLENNAQFPLRTSFIGLRVQTFPRGGPALQHLEAVAQQPLRRLRDFEADILVVNDAEPVNGKQQKFLDQLLAEEMNYKPVLRPRYVPWVGDLELEGAKTNLTVVNPPLTVLQRVSAWGLTDAEIQQALVGIDRGTIEPSWEDLATGITATPILDQRGKLGPETTTFGLSPDGWTRGTQPAALVIENRRKVPISPVLNLSCGASGADLPLVVSISAEAENLIVEFSEAGRQRFTLPVIPSKTQRLFVISTDRAWSPTTGAKRRLGVKIHPPKLRKAASSENDQPDS